MCVKLVCMYEGARGGHRGPVLRVATARVLPCSPWQPGVAVWYSAWARLQVVSDYQPPVAG